MHLLHFLICIAGNKTMLSTQHCNLPESLLLKKSVNSGVFRTGSQTQIAPWAT